MKLDPILATNTTFPIILLFVSKAIWPWYAWTALKLQKTICFLLHEVIVGQFAILSDKKYWFTAIYCIVFMEIYV